MKVCVSKVLLAASIGCSLLSVPVAAQTLGKDKKPIAQLSANKNIGSTPVTRLEAATIFRKVDVAVAKSILKTAPPAQNPKPSPGAISRADIINEFHRIFELCKGKFKYTAIPGLIEPELITIPETTPTRKSVEKLISWGFIGRYDPLATSKAPGMIPEDFGFAVAQFISRLCELTHTPSSKFSPSMMREDG